MIARVPQFSKRLSEAFSLKDFHESHRRAGSVLAEMADDPSVLHEIALGAIRSPDFFERKRINPVIALKVAETREFTLIAHLWLPLDDGRTDLTHQSVHHHGNLLLTSMSAWGEGYESVLFKPGFSVVSESGETRMEIEKIYRNPFGHLEFVGPRTPHVVFFPAGFTVTYALWSVDRPHAAASWIKRLPGVQAYKKRIKDGLHKLGLASSLGLNVVENLDFFPREGKIIQMKERVNYRPGSAENYLQNFFWSLQQMKFDRIDALRARVREDGGRTQAAHWFKLLERGQAIPRKMEAIHLGVERVQFGRRELLECFAPLAAPQAEYGLAR